MAFFGDFEGPWLCLVVLTFFVFLSGFWCFLGAFFMVLGDSLWFFEVLSGSRNFLVVFGGSRFS